MNLLLAVFRSRTQTLAFADAMRRQGLYSAVVSTPSEARVGCGVSAKFRYEDLRRAEMILRRYRSGLYGVFEVLPRDGGRQLRRLQI